MWKVFKECIWDSAWGKVFAMLGSASSIWSLILIFSPNINKQIPSSIQVDTRIWFGITIAFLLSACILALRGASKYKHLLEAKGHMTIIYIKNTLPFKEVFGTTEHHRIGIRVLGIEEVKDPEIIPRKFIRIRSGRLPKDMKYTKIPILPLALKPMINTNVVHLGRTVTYFVNVLEHPLKSSEIQFCYNYNAQLAPISLDTNSEYKLEIMARGQHHEMAFLSLMLQLDKNNNLDVNLLEDGEK